MNKTKYYYQTTTLPYVNAEPHIGFALEIVQADAVARFKKMQGYEVFFNFGTDEHGLKIYRKAQEQNKDPQEYVDEYAAKFDNLKNALKLSYNNFIRTTDSHHKKSAQELWKRCKENGYIEKGIYKAKYCVGCEMEKQDSELIDGKCPLHPTLEIQLIEEENYFFKFSKFQDKLLDLYKNNKDFVVPHNRLKEIENFVSEGLQDFSVSRLKEKMPWGVPVPGDSEHIMYVWFDALANYISALGWPEDGKKFEKYWGIKEKPNAIQFAGKDNLRQQSAMWQAMLMAADLPPSKQILIHGFITVDGQKISKSLGNAINPIEYVEKYGCDALRYYLLAKINPFEDSDFTKEKFEEAYNADLANGIGNLVARVAKLGERIKFSVTHHYYKFDNKYIELIDNYEFNKVSELIWSWISDLDQLINKTEPWKFDVNNKIEVEKLADFLLTASAKILDIAFHLKPLLPDTAERIVKQFGETEIKSTEPLFPRLK